MAIEVNRGLSFGSRVRLARDARGMSQETLARETGVTKQTISNIENDRYRGAEYGTVIGICEVLQIPLPDRDAMEGLMPEEVYRRSYRDIPPERRGLLQRAVDRLFEEFRVLAA